VTLASVDVNGICDPRFAPVREVFARNFTEFPEGGAAVAVAIDGKILVDLWAGTANAARSRAWERDTIVNVYSTTKGMVALAAHMLADRGKLDFDAPVARYWPEFAQAGKERLPVRYLLTHQAGLPDIDGELPAGAALDWNAMTTALAAERPRWEPGTKQGYHTSTYGWLVGEVIRRVSGKTPGQFIRDEIAKPLGVSFHLGFNPIGYHVAEILQDNRQGVSSRGANALRGVASAMRGVDPNSREYRMAELPASNGHANARALATIYGALARGGEWGKTRLLSPWAIERASVEQANGIDETLKVPTHRTLGFMLRFAEFGDARPATSFGHAGSGGSQGFADPAKRLGFGYVMNQMMSPLPGDPRPPTGGMDPRGQHLVRAVYACL
jgi:CubicO group peptidase (beta-lactamase class C family)